MRRVILESPFAADSLYDRIRNVEYAQHCMRHSLMSGEAPYASHLLYTQPNMLDDDNPDERRRGIEAGFEFREVCEKTVVYTDRGISNGMLLGIEHAESIGHEVEFRVLGGHWGRR